MAKNNTTNAKLMSKNRLGWLFGIFLWSIQLLGQDKIPTQLTPQDTLRNPDIHIQYGLATLHDPVEVSNSLPAGFRNAGENLIQNPTALAFFFAKLCSGTEPVRVVQIGDSHIRGHVLPVATRHTLEHAWGAQAVYPDEITYRTEALAHETGAPGLVYHAIGQNGATASDFCSTEKVEQISALHPDLIIVSFGTNESHNRRYDPMEHFTQMDALLTLLRHYNPDATVMLTTPPGSYVRSSRRKRIVNPRTEKTVETILDFARQRDLPVWDLYNLAGGGPSRACTNWKNNRLMQRDQIHFTHQGYIIQGNLLGEALLKAFNDYVAN